ncbi:MAG: class I SAM-dependent methyltransferase, partial [Vicinamibacterales bacterium]
MSELPVGSTGRGGDAWWDGFWRDHAVRAPEDSGETWYDAIWSTMLARWLDAARRYGLGRDVLECGCGSARFSVYFRRHGYRVTMLDYSRTALDLARETFRTTGQPGRFVRGDVTRLCLRGEQFDIVYSGGVLEFVGDLDGAIAEMARVLKPGGMLAATVVPRKVSIQTLANIQRTIAYTLRAVVTRSGPRWSPVQAVPDSYPVHPWALNDYAAACRKAGLIDVTARVTGPFPAFALPASLQARYARAMRRLGRFWL